MKSGMEIAHDMLNRHKMWKKGKNPWITIENPDPNARNKRHIRVKANEYWGHPRRNIDLQFHTVGEKFQ